MAAALAFAVPFLVYLRTLAPTIYGLDSAELTTGAYSLGIVHAPGSPTYLILGHAFSWLPIGDVGYRLNLMSAAAASVSVLCIYGILRHLTGQRLIALGSAWFVAFSYYFWTSAVAAELYAVSVCFFTALLWLAIRLRENCRPRWLYLFGLIYGVGLGTHLSLALLGPGLAWLVLARPVPRWRMRELLMGAFCILFGALVYLYIPIRYLSHPPFNYASGYWRVNLASIDGFWWMITARMFGSLFFAIPMQAWPGELFSFLGQLLSNFLGLASLIGLVGLIGDCRRRLSLQIGLMLMMGIYLAFYIPYGAGDKDTMFLPVYVIWGIEVGLGFDILRGWVQRHDERRLAGLTVLVLLTAVSALMVNFRFADLSQDRRAREWGEAILTNIEPNADYIGTWADTPILEYLQIVEKQKTGVTVVNLFFSGVEQARMRAEEELALGIPVYTSTMIFPEDEFELQRVETCQCYKVTLQPTRSGRPK